MRDVWVGTLDGESLIRLTDMESVRVSRRTLEARTRTWGTVVLAEGEQDALARAAGELLDLASPFGDGRFVVRARTTDGVIGWETTRLDPRDGEEGEGSGGSASGSAASPAIDKEAWLAQHRPPEAY